MHKFSANCLFLTPTIAVRNLSNLPKTLKNQDCSKCINYNLGILIRNSRLLENPTTEKDIERIEQSLEELEKIFYETC